MIKSRSDKIFDAINYSLLSLVFLLVLYPLIFILVASISDPKLVVTGKIWLIPKGISLEGYQAVFDNGDIWIGYRNTIFYTVVGTLINLGVTLTCAFALSRKDFIGRNFFMALFVFTMYFSGGLIPTFLIIKKLNLINTVWALIIPSAASMYNIIITRTFMASSIPFSLQEAAKIDGSSDAGIFFKIILPLSKPIIAVMALFYGVAHWNVYFNALIYLSDRKLFPLQLILREILVQNANIDVETICTAEMDAIVRKAYLAETMKYSVIFIASFPVLVAYPFLQKYFVKGVMVGAIKG